MLPHMDPDLAIDGLNRTSVGLKPGETAIQSSEHGTGLNRTSVGLKL